MIMNYHKLAMYTIISLQYQTFPRTQAHNSFFTQLHKPSTPQSQLPTTFFKATQYRQENPLQLPKIETETAPETVSAAMPDVGPQPIKWPDNDSGRGRWKSLSEHEQISPLERTPHT